MIEWVSVALAPQLSFTVSVTTYDPSFAYACPTFDPRRVDPSPKAHVTSTMDPSESSDPEESNVTHSPGAGMSVDSRQLTVGAVFSISMLTLWLERRPSLSTTVSSIEWIPDVVNV